MPARARQDDEANSVIAVELFEHDPELVACRHRHAVELSGDVERDSRDAALVVALDAEAVVLAHVPSQHSPQDLPRRALRQFGDEAVLARPLEASERVGGQTVRVELLPGDPVVGHDAGDDALAEAVVGAAITRPPHARNAHQHVLDLDRMDVLAARDDHVVDASYDPEVAVLVDPADVARVVPAVANRLCIRVGPVPVARERLVRAHVAEDLAVAGGSRWARVERRAAGASRLRALVPVNGEGVDLGRAVVVDEDLGIERG